MANSKHDLTALADLVEHSCQSENKFVFLIMSLSRNPIIESYYEEAIKPTIEKFNYQCVRIDKENFSGKITDNIKKNIANSKLVIVDLTEDKPNCYFEAGFALAIGKTVMFQRLNAPRYEPKIEFNIQDYPHILYETISTLRLQLEEKLSVLLDLA